ncbi:TetR/AcrR family transcriptional regulator [Clostridium algidicarnis]|uniref:TetR family transcriptional regulator n=1 Tax=Clostridium algidicarnis DSM 15099 TaxID=1121295 RepID=A0A2S6FUJ2_9CLOT|nr:TetR/AcrR family transcriptional regulator [Clostridium algidicarnis]MBB6631686.1 TetR/AcrR family transcriptional regulator [Clostridium algidicarnis]MBB6698484.1 TetR/AcrR family transcriptional regulator [Clostridium algidicarnis]MCB2287123.1 TetR/AcrR family transcriptional regulator [Clostridium algidicarnis]PPK44398.1 TetR family transcriptional regulator [Clostridium algidicarnis DSM 15099]
MNKEDRRKQILDAAMTVFTEKGFNGSTTLEIAKAANIAEVTLFRYFSSKQEIFLEGIKPILFSTLEETINASKELNAEEKLEYILYERISLISNNYKTVKLILTEAPLLEELGSENFMSKILQILESMLTQIGVSINDKGFILRILMGSILSFLYMPEMDEENIKNYVSKVVSIILKETNK